MWNPFDRATGAAALLFTFFKYNSWAVVTLGETAGNEANDTRFKDFVGGNQNRSVTVNHRFSCFALFFGHALALAVELLQRLRKAACGIAIGGSQQAGSIVGMCEATGGIDAWADAEGDVFGRNLP